MCCDIVYINRKVPQYFIPNFQKLVYNFQLLGEPNKKEKLKLLNASGLWALKLTTQSVFIFHIEFHRVLQSESGSAIQEDTLIKVQLLIRISYYK